MTMAEMFYYADQEGLLETQEDDDEEEENDLNALLDLTDIIFDFPANHFSSEAEAIKYAEEFTGIDMSLREGDTESAKLTRELYESLKEKVCIKN